MLRLLPKFPSRIAIPLPTEHLSPSDKDAKHTIGIDFPKHFLPVIAVPPVGLVACCGGEVPKKKNQERKRWGLNITFSSYPEPAALLARHP
jgi:hypothetical protein